jgi:1,4-dihydroxy-2-naphthoate octaprenyltransferase
MALQVATNMLNTYGDFMSGVDSAASASTCPQLTSGRFTPQELYRGAMAAFVFAGIIGVGLAFARGPEILPFGLLGIAGGYLYTNGKRPYKYLGLGPYGVFMLMGPLMVLPAFFVQAGHFSLLPLPGSISIACFVAAIMHANDIRDIEFDRAAGIRTLAMRLGVKKSVRLYSTLTLGGFAVLGLSVVNGFLPLFCLLPCLMLPRLVREILAMRKAGYDFTPLEALSGKFHLQFGLLLTAGLIAAIVLRAAGR